MRIVHFSHRGLKRFGVLLSDDRVLDLTHFFGDENTFRSAGEEGRKTVLEAIERARLRRSAGGTLYALDDIVIESPDLAVSTDIEPHLGRSGMWSAQPGLERVSTGIDVEVVRRARAGRS